MKIPLVMSCADGRVRARQDAMFGINPVSNDAVTAKTASYTITGREYACAFSNEGATGSVTFTLPTCYKGAVVGPIFKMANQTLVVDRKDSEALHPWDMRCLCSLHRYSLLLAAPPWAAGFQD